MLRKILRDLLMLLAFAVLLFSSWRVEMEKLQKHRDEWTGPLGPHDNLTGDLASMAYLDGMARFRSPIDYRFRKARPDTGAIALYLQGDSFVWRIPDSAFAALRSYHYAWRFRDDLRYTLDTNAYNVLFIETAERYLLDYFTAGHFFRHVYDSAHGPAPGHTDPGPPLKPFKDLPDGTEDFIWHASPNLEYLLFNYAALDPVRQAKAALTYHLFGRASGDVVVSRDGQRLFLKETVALDDIHSSYSPVSDSLVQRVADTLNAIGRHYRAEGFDAVVVSIIPNAASIYQPGGYNRLIPRLQGHPGLELPVLDAYWLFKNHRLPLFHRGDTHWNSHGLNWWLDEVNRMLREMNVRAQGRVRSTPGN